MNEVNARIHKAGVFLMRFLLLAPFLLTLSTVFIIDRSLANGVVSGKYFWFYGSMGLVVLATFFYSLPLPLNPLKETWNQSNPQPFRFSLTDGFVLLFAGSVFLPAFLIGGISANSTKITLFALLLVLYFCLRLVLDGEGRKVNGERRKAKGEGRTAKGEGQTISFAFYRSPFTVYLLCFFIILTGLVEAVWGLQQLYGFKPSQHALFKFTGSFFNPGPYAGYLAVVFPLALYYARSYKKLKGVIGSCKKLQEVIRSYRKLQEVRRS